MERLNVLREKLINEIGGVRSLGEDRESWLYCLGQIPKSRYVPLQYKPGFLEYQSEYFQSVYDGYADCSMVLYRGGTRVGIWPLCMYYQQGRLHFGTAGAALMGPLFSALPKAEAQRNVIETCLQGAFNIIRQEQGAPLRCSETVLDQGNSQWMKKLMEHGARTVKVTWQAFADLSLSPEEVQSRIRRTNKYSAARGREEYHIEIYDCKSSCLDRIFRDFHDMHREVSGRETRNQKTWDIQENLVRDKDERHGRSFVVFIRDKETGVLAGSALFDSTPQTGLYCVAAYDRSRFSKPVGHIVQAVAMERMRAYGLRWYEIGERAYPSDEGSDPKLVNIGHYKEGFATHLFPRVFVELSCNDFEKSK